MTVDVENEDVLGIEFEVSELEYTGPTLTKDADMDEAVVLSDDDGAVTVVLAA